VAFLRRHIEPALRRAAATFPAVLLTGARQTGKTTLLRERFRTSHRYVSLERPDVRARALADPVGFLADRPPPLILDEIQLAPTLLHYVKDRIDEDGRSGRFLLTGSQSLALMRGVSQTLAGRVAVLTLDPLSLAECLRRRTLAPELRLARLHPGTLPARVPRAPSLGSWALRGGFPALRLRARLDRRLWLASYVQTYLERDVRDLLQVGDLTAFGRFLALVAARNGQLLNLADLGREAGVSAPTARSWLSVLEATQLVFLLRPFHESFGKRLVKSPKLYVLDPALVTFLTGVHGEEAALQGPGAGALLESIVVAEWVKAHRQAGEAPSLWFWRSSGGDEVDLVVERDGLLHGVEVKSTATPLPGHASGLAKWLDLVGSRGRGALACRIDRPTALAPRIRAVPWWWA
jgi:predicted AAA+ superfamily ATPase